MQYSKPFEASAFPVPNRADGTLPAGGSAIPTAGRENRDLRCSSSLAAGSVWGDIASTGVGGADQTRLESEIWDQKPVMDGIRYVKDIVAYTRTGSGWAMA